MINEYIELVMDDIGCPKHLRGYESLYGMIKRRIEYPYENITDSYRFVAELHETTASATERNIRHLVTWMLHNCDYSKIYNYFGNSAPIRGGITNKQFIVTLATAVKRNAQSGGKNA